MLSKNGQCSKACGSGSRNRPILCLAYNETADIKQCGVDTIPSTEEKCNAQACSEETTAEGTTETPLVEVCEEVDAEGEEEEEEEEVMEELIEESSGSNVGMEPSSGSGSMDNLLVDMSAEGSGDMASESVILL